MKYRLNDNAREFLETVVAPDELNTVIQYAEKEAGENEKGLIEVYLHSSDTKSGIGLNLILFVERDFTEVEELKPYVWYPREKFDDNPHDYGLAEYSANGRLSLHHILNNYLSEKTTHFMYIEKPSKE